MLSFEGGGMGFRRTILLTRLSFWTTSTRNGRRKKGWRIGRIASRSRLNTREVACWLGQRESSSRPTTLLNRHRLIFLPDLIDLSPQKFCSRIVKVSYFSFYWLLFLLSGVLWSRPRTNPEEVQNCHTSRAWTCPSQASRWRKGGRIKSQFIPSSTFQ